MHARPLAEYEPVSTADAELQRFDGPKIAVLLNLKLGRYLKALLFMFCSPDYDLWFINY